MQTLRVAFCGASGTGKTTLAKYVAETYGLEINPVGSRSVAQAMGLMNPYDVDAAGRRGEFQRKLLADKMLWESEHDSFVTDRTTIDNLLYQILHDVSSVDGRLLEVAYTGLQRYTDVFFCLKDVFFDISNDPVRVIHHAYHTIYDRMLQGLMLGQHDGIQFVTHPRLSYRKEFVRAVLDGDDGHDIEAFDD